jgi:predicted membrane chloride channel (bestrophin family)
MASTSGSRTTKAGTRELVFEGKIDEEDVSEKKSLTAEFLSGRLHGEGRFKAYETEDLVTLNVFLIIRGTIFTNKGLWLETGVMAILFWGTAAALFFYRPDHFNTFVGKETNLRAFIAMFSTLIGLLLSFYTALNLGRWWQMRVAVKQVHEACKKIIMFLAHGVTNDQELLEKVQHYARCSLFLVFRLQAQAHQSPLEEALKEDFITQDEHDVLRELNPHMTFVQCEALWAWIATIVSRLHEQGLLKGPPHYCALMHAVDAGREGITDIQTLLETPIPMGYVHLLCFMVKLHNVILTLLMAMLLAVKLLHDKEGDGGVGVFRASFRAFFMPFLYNAILQLNSEVTNPFGEDYHDFQVEAFDIDLQASANILAKSATKLPSFLLANRKFEKYEPPTYSTMA